MDSNPYLYREEVFGQRERDDEVLARQVVGVAAEVQLSSGVVPQPCSHHEEAL